MSVIAHNNATAFKYVVLGSPVPLARARHGNKKTWDSQKAIKYGWGLQLRSQHAGRPLYSTPLHLDICFYFEMPQSLKSKWDTIRGKPHHFKPDLSNLIKFVEDVATSIIYTDDSLIASTCARKVYDDTPRTELTISEITL